MTPCDTTYNTTKWCCGRNNSDCCSDWDHHPSAVSIPLVLAQSATPTLLSTQTSTPVPSNINSPTSHGSNLSAGAKAGIGVGAAFGGLLLFGLGFMAARIRKIRKTRKKAEEYEVREQVQVKQDGGLLAYGGDSVPPGIHDTHEAHSLPSPVEMPLGRDVS